MHPLIEAAADGRLPDWAEASPRRLDHMARVAELMAAWARDLEPDPAGLARWRAVAMLHDALRDADPAALRPTLPSELRGLPDGLLHGPAAADRLEADGVEDTAILTAVRWHTLGHPDLDRLGRALYLADFLEPGRHYAADRHAALRDRVPYEMAAVLQEVLVERIGKTLRRGHPLRSPTVAFWNGVVDG
ncbi:MAG: HD domain-containing protein [Gemmatimonadota bacterium]